MKRKQAASQLVLIIGGIIRISIKADSKFHLRNPGPPQSSFCVSPSTLVVRFLLLKCLIWWLGNVL